MSEIYLIRHGQASFGSENYDRLSKTGERQSRILGEFLVENRFSFDAVYMGDMLRHRQTAEPYLELCKKNGIITPEPEIMTAWNEYNADSLLRARMRLENTSRESLEKLKTERKSFQIYFAQTVLQWMRGDLDSDGDIEVYTDFIRRVAEGLNMVMNRHGKGRRIVVFTSGGPISAVLKTALDVSHEKAVELSWQTMNASLTCIKYNAKGTALSFFNNTTHLVLRDDASLLTYR